MLLVPQMSRPLELVESLPALIYFSRLLCWVFVAALELSLVVKIRDYYRDGAQVSHCGGFSCCRARVLGTQASVVVACRPYSRAQ